MIKKISTKIPSRVQFIFKVTIFLLFIYQLLRGGFYFFNIDHFSTVTGREVAFAFLHGLRFDLYSILWLNAPLFLVLLLLPNRLQGGSLFRQLALAWLFLVNCFFIGFNVSDWEFFSFSGKRTTMDIFFLAEEIGGMGFDIVTFYPIQTVVGFSILALVFFGCQWIVRKHQHQIVNDQTSKPVNWGFSLLMFSLIFIGMRGGLQLKPIRPISAFIGVSQPTGALVLNSTFTMLRSKPSESFKPVNFYSSFAEVTKTLENGLKSRTSEGSSNPNILEEASNPSVQEYSSNQRSRSFGSFKDHNVVLIILESFAQEYTGLSGLDLPSYTPFLDELVARPGVRVFSRNFANGRRSIDAVPALLAGIPLLMSQPFVSSNFQTNRILGWGEVLKDTGYETAFFHGAKNGSMSFDSFSAQAGFTEYYGLNEFPESEKYSDGSWGIFDEPFFLFTVEKLSQKKKPFAAVLFSLSSHHPYPIPEKFKGKFPKGNLDIHESIGYTDFSLKRFFEVAKSKPWFNNTVFIITGDHTSKSQHPKSQTLYGAHRVPLIVYSPEKSLPKTRGKVFTQHIDIPKTIYHLLGVQPKFNTLFGVNIFELNETERQGEVYNFAYPGYWYLNSDGLFQFDDAGQRVSRQSVENWHKDPQDSENTNEKVSARMRAWLQYYINGLLKNLWFEEVPESL